MECSGEFKKERRVAEEKGRKRENDRMENRKVDRLAKHFSCVM